MPITKLTPDADNLIADRLEALRQLVPEAFADGRINWDTLRELLGAYLEEPEDGDEDEIERFGLFWPGKRLARRAAAMPAQGALAPAPGEGVNEETTRNLFIEGDNLEVLKLLRKSYAGKVKMIYIDPPYNTGHDFVYPDDYSEPVESYLRRTGQMDEDGTRLTTNVRTGGRYHSNWLNMMYPRLVLARGLLSEDGLLFVSIDDCEESNLRIMLDEVFGAENQLSKMVWKKSYGGGAKAKHVVGLHEYVLLYASRADMIPSIDLPPDPSRRRYYKHKDDKVDVRGPYRTQPLATTSMDDRPNLRYAIPYNGVDVWPEKQWQWSRKRTMAALANDELVFTETSSGVTVYYKQYLRDEDGRERGAKPYSLLEGPYTQKGTAAIRQLFGDGKTFPFPKPVELISHLLRFSGEDADSLVLDFFSGSCTTAHAVLNLNREDGGNRRFIMVQLPEPTGRDDYATIAEIGKERIRRVIAKMQAEAPPEGVEREAPEDLGFKVFTLGKSNVKPWQAETHESTGALQRHFDDFQTPLVEGWNADGLLTEIMLQEGFPLDSVVAAAAKLDGNSVRCVTSDWCEHKLFVCLDDAVSRATAEALPDVMGDDDVFVCLDSALTDEIKVTLDDRLNVKVI